MRRERPLPHNYKRDLQLLSGIIALESERNAEREARKLLRRFGSLNAVLSASREGCLSNLRQSPEGANSIRLVSEVSLEIIRGHVTNRTIVADDWQLGCYLLTRLDGLERSRLWVLYLDGAHRIIHEECCGVGTIDKVSVYPSEIIRSALRANASGIILAQNRASGNSAPTHYDLELTEHVRAAAEIFSIAIHDHFIVANGEIRSLLSLLGVHRNEIIEDRFPNHPPSSSISKGLVPGWWRK